MLRPLLPSAAVAAITLSLVITACSADGPGDLGPPSTTPPEAGSSVVTCELETDDGPLTFSFVLQDTYTPDPDSAGSGCAWARPAPPRSDLEVAPGADSSVALAWIGDDGSLQDVYDFNEPFLVDGVEDDGDDEEEISERRLSEDVVVFGETIGDRLRWDCSCAGVPSVTYLSQAAGVRLLWYGAAELQDQIEDEVRTALASAGAG